MVETAYELARERLGACGLHCGKCYAYTDGDMPVLSSQLANSLGNFEVYARRFVELVGDPVFLKYPDFRDFLGYLAEGKCEEFPCDHTGFDEHLYRRYVSINERMKEIGVEAYYEEVKNQPRY